MFGLVTALIALSGRVAAHSWIEHVQKINSNGTLVGDGYPRGFVSRQQPPPPGTTYDELAMYAPVQGTVNLDPKMPVCKSTQQTQNITSYQGKKFTPIEAAPNSWISLLYQDNGHVTFPFNQKGKPPGGGHVYVYGTPKSSPDDTFEPIWDPKTHTFGPPKDTSNGLQLLAVRNFDDGVCHQGGVESEVSKERDHKYPHNENDPIQGNNVWCQTNLRLPEGISDTYTLYWIWNWRTEPHKDCDLWDGKDEIYTTCLDVKVVDESSDSDTPHLDPKSVHDWDTVARPNQLTISGSTAAPSPPSTPSMSGEPTGPPACQQTPDSQPVSSPPAGPITPAGPQPSLPPKSTAGSPPASPPLSPPTSSVALPSNMFPVSTSAGSARAVELALTKRTADVRDSEATIGVRYASRVSLTKMVTLARAIND